MIWFFVRMVNYLACLWLVKDPLTALGCAIGLDLLMVCGWAVIQ